MQHIIYRLLLAGLIVSTAISCGKDRLKPKPLSFYTPGTTFKDGAAMRAVLAACEKSLRTEWYATGAPIHTQLIFSEVAVEGVTDKSSPAQDMNLQITPDAELNNVSYNMIGWYWTEGYKSIKYANTVISRIDEPKYASEAERNAILGAAYFHRAYRYYTLSNAFGDVPVILKEISDGAKLDFFSTKREVILQRMKENLEYAAQWVPDQGSKGEVTKGAVLHLLTKVNLALGKFDDAIQSASQVIDGGKYHLMQQRFGVDKNNTARNVVWDLHRPENKALAENTEALMLVIDRQDVEGNFAGGSLIMYNTLPNWYAFINTPNGNKGTSDKAGIEIDQSTQYGRGAGKCRGTWYSTHTIWENDPGDYRHAPGNWMRMEDLLYNNPGLKGSDSYYGKPLQRFNSQGVLLCSDTIRAWYEWPHYKLYIPDFENTPARGGHTDWYVFRLAETYLLRAEAYYWKGNEALAAADVNTVRARANALPVATANMETILDERARELFYEEPRKTELTRIAYLYAQTGKPAANGKTYSRQNFSTSNYWYDRIMAKTDFYNKGVVTAYGNRYTLSPYHVLWPVPQNAISSNTQGTINQNEGYSGFENNVPPLTAIPE